MYKFSFVSWDRKYRDKKVKRFDFGGYLISFKKITSFCVFAARRFIKFHFPFSFFFDNPTEKFPLWERKIWKYKNPLSNSVHKFLSRGFIDFISYFCTIAGSFVVDWMKISTIFPHFNATTNLKGSEEGKDGKHK